MFSNFFQILLRHFKIGYSYYDLIVDILTHYMVLYKKYRTIQYKNKIPYFNSSKNMYARRRLG